MKIYETKVKEVTQKIEKMDKFADKIYNQFVGSEQVPITEKVKEEINQLYADARYDILARDVSEGSGTQIVEKAHH